mmetsp:Transcript_64204/g.100126  ORF Transcript_64204/g.100126 Transcript_64204/m.100126 type:complete len:233 (+) Transcript_64204:316-1014(+)
MVFAGDTESVASLPPRFSASNFCWRLGRDGLPSPSEVLPRRRRPVGCGGERRTSSVAIASAGDCSSHIASSSACEIPPTEPPQDAGHAKGAKDASTFSSCATETSITSSSIGLSNRRRFLTLRRAEPTGEPAYRSLVGSSSTAKLSNSACDKPPILVSLTRSSVAPSSSVCAWPRLWSHLLRARSIEPTGDEGSESESSQQHNASNSACVKPLIGITQRLSARARLGEKTKN